ncbi:MAG: archaemetzincin family Zn-dependent metalloprotease [Nitrospirota bacterium]
MWFAEAKKIYIMPIGRVSGPVISEIEEEINRTFKKRVEILEQVSLPLDAYNRGRQQCWSTKILEKLGKMEFDGMVLGVIDVDLYVPGLNFVFGEADPVSGNAIISITRLKQEFYGERQDHSLFLRRVVKEAVHEIGHLYGLSHCPDSRCVMYFSNSIRDTDEKKAEFCKVCWREVNTSCRNKNP